MKTITAQLIDFMILTKKHFLWYESCVKYLMGEELDSLKQVIKNATVSISKSRAIITDLDSRLRPKMKDTQARPETPPAPRPEISRERQVPLCEL
jgi:hypothetical protein